MAGTDQAYTYQVMSNIQVSPSGVSIVFNSMDVNIASLLYAALTFQAQSPVAETSDVSTLTITSTKGIVFQ